MRWSDLHREVQNILEFLEDPYTDSLRVLSIKEGERLKIDDDFSQRHPNVVTKDQFDEIVRWSEDKKSKSNNFIVREENGLLRIGYENACAWRKGLSIKSDSQSEWEADGPTFFR